jgi:hypothetical protein
MYLIWDIETVEDDDTIYETSKELIGEVAGKLVWEERGPCIQRIRDKECAKQPEANCFLPPRYQRPVVVGMLAIGADGSYIAHQTINASVAGMAAGTPAEVGTKRLVEKFWVDIAGVRGPPVNAHKWVTFNGKGFDAPVMEAWGFRFGLQMPVWFSGGFDSKPWEDPRSNHLDLMLYLGGQGYGPHKGGSLSHWARTFGLPGKTGVSGADSRRLWAEGEVAKLEEYCMTDCMNTAGVLLGVLRAQGHDVAPRSEAFEKTMLRVCDSAPGSKIYEAFWKAYGPTLPF